MADRDLRSIVDEALRSFGCNKVEFDVSLGRGRAKADAVGYLYTKSGFVPAVMVDIQIAFSLEALPKTFSHAEKIGVDTLALTDGSQWAWYEKTQSAWRRFPDAPDFRAQLTTQDQHAYASYVMADVLTRLLNVLRRTRSFDLNALTALLYPCCLYVKAGGSLSDLEPSPTKMLGSIMAEQGLSSQWTSFDFSDADVLAIIHVLKGSDVLFAEPFAEVLYEAIFDQRTEEPEAPSSVLATNIAALLSAVLPTSATVLDPAARAGSILAATMLHRRDLSFTALDEGPSAGFIPRLLFAMSSVALDYRRCDFLRTNLDELPLVDAVVLDSPHGRKIENPEVLRYYELSRGKPTSIEVLFVERSVSVLKPGGYLVAVLPLALLMRPTDQHVREFLLRECVIEAVLEAPDGVRAGSPAKACVLVCRKKGADVLPSDSVTMLHWPAGAHFHKTAFAEAISTLVQQLPSPSEV